MSAGGNSPGGALRVWILALALGSFAAGAAAGMLLPEMLAADQAVESPVDGYVRQLVARYSLDAEQERQLRLVLLADAKAEGDILRNADWSELPENLNNERLRNKRRTEERIRYVLTDEQRARYDRDSCPDGSAVSRAK